MTAQTRGIILDRLGNLRIAKETTLDPTLKTNYVVAIVMLEWVLGLEGQETRIVEPPQPPFLCCQVLWNSVAEWRLHAGPRCRPYVQD